jgi:DNA topoisomerase IA
MVSPLLWEKIGRGLSAGRVQSVAVKLIVEKYNLNKNEVYKKALELKND